MSRRAHGAGSVSQRQTGGWVAAVTIAGQQVRRYAGSEEEARLLLDRLQGQPPLPALQRWLRQ
jgi:hypothetical protein